MTESIKLGARKALFQIIHRLVLNYFQDGITLIYSSNDEFKVIAYEWRFYDPEYEKEKYGKIN